MGPNGSGKSTLSYVLAGREGGQVNISGETFEVVRDYFPCQYRGKIAAKNKGEIDMYFVGN